MVAPAPRTRFGWCCPHLATSPTAPREHAQAVVELAAVLGEGGRPSWVGLRVRVEEERGCDQTIIFNLADLLIWFYHVLPKDYSKTSSRHVLQIFERKAAKLGNRKCHRQSRRRPQMERFALHAGEKKGGVIQSQVLYQDLPTGGFWTPRSTSRGYQ